LVFILCLTIWLFHKFDLLGWIALVFTVLSGLRIAIVVTHDIRYVLLH